MSAILLAFTDMGKIDNLAWVACLATGIQLFPAITLFYPLNAIADARLAPANLSQATEGRTTDARTTQARLLPRPAFLLQSSRVDGYQPPDVGGPATSGGSGTR
jgi:hypothetical protein